jgi:hypothetical protein
MLARGSPRVVRHGEMEIKPEPGDIKVKREGEPAGIKAEREGGPPPWAVKVKREGGVIPLVQMGREHPPWERPAREEEQTPPPPRKRWRAHGPSVAAVRKARRRAEREDPEALDATEGRLVCLKNYAAVETATGRYGLIDQGVQERGIQTLVMHTPRSSLRETRQEEEIRPGSILRVSSTSEGGRSGPLRVRFLTPARYYSPGTRVSTLCIGVDASDWQDLMPKHRRI